MFRFTLITLFSATALYVALSAAPAAAQTGYPIPPSRTYTIDDWQRHYHYPYRYFPQNYQSQEYYKASADPTHRYPPEMRVPRYYDKSWQNYYPVPRKYHFGHHFKLDVLQSNTNFGDRMSTAVPLTGFEFVEDNIFSKRSRKNSNEKSFSFLENPLSCCA